MVSLAKGFCAKANDNDFIHDFHFSARFPTTTPIHSYLLKSMPTDLSLPLTSSITDAIDDFVYHIDVQYGRRIV